MTSIKGTPIVNPYNPGTDIYIKFPPLGESIVGVWESDMRKVTITSPPNASEDLSKYHITIQLTFQHNLNERAAREKKHFAHQVIYTRRLWFNQITPRLLTRITHNSEVGIVPTVEGLNQGISSDRGLEAVFLLTKTFQDHTSPPSSLEAYVKGTRRGLVSVGKFEEYDLIPNSKFMEQTLRSQGKDITQRALLKITEKHYHHYPSE